MSRAFLAEIIYTATGATRALANNAAADLVDAIIDELKSEGSFTLVGFGTFSVRKTKARKARNPGTGETIRVRAGKTVRFKPSPALKKSV